MIQRLDRHEMIFAIVVVGLCILALVGVAAAALTYVWSWQIGIVGAAVIVSVIGAWVAERSWRRRLH